MRTIPLIEILALLSIFVAPAAHAQSREETTVLVEGHVFNLRTGTPIRGAFVFPIPDVAFDGPLTDANGFFSLEVDLAIYDSLVATCRFQSRGKPETTSLSSSLLPTRVVDYLRRDFYLDVQRSTAQVHCLAPVS
jgi:hypothetical protein